MYARYAPQKEALWSYYIKANDAQIEDVPYFDLTPEQLFDQYEEAAKDIAFLWKQDPEYKLGKMLQVVRSIAAAIVTLICSEIMAGLVASAAVDAGAVRTFRVANGMRITQSAVPIGSELQLALLNTARASGVTARTARDTIGSFLAMSALMVTDMAIFEEAEQALVRPQKQIQMLFLTGEDIISTMKSPDAAAQKMRVRQRKRALQQVWERMQQEKRNSILDLLFRDNRYTMATLRQVIREQYQGGWGDDPDEAIEVQNEVIAAVYALEYIRAEMSDLKDAFRYRKAAKNLVLMYTTNDFTELYDRGDLESAVRAEYKHEEDQVRKEINTIRDMKSGIMDDYVSLYPSYRI